MAVKTVAEIRALDAATFGHLLVLDGVGTAFTDRPELVGTGASSWIGQGYGHWEILGGLEVPESLENQIDIRRCKFEHSSARVKILEDADGTLTALFATKGKSPKYIAGLRSSVATTGATIIHPDGVTAVDVQGKHIGTEYIGSGSDGFVAGDRRCFHCFPFAGANPAAGLPFDHVWRGWDDPLVSVSDEPIEYAGRWFALYRIYKDPDLNTGDYTDWPDWHLQYNAGGLMYCGKLRDQGTISQAREGRKWSLGLLGWRSLLEKLLNEQAPEPDPWYTVSSPLAFRTTPGQAGGRTDKLAVIFWSHQAYSTAETLYHGAEWHDNQTLTETDPVSLALEIDGYIEDVEDDTTKNITEDTYFGDPATTGHPRRFSFNRDHVTISIDNYATIASTRYAAADVVLHRKVWQHLGWDFHLYKDEITGDLYAGGQNELDRASRRFVSLNAPSPGNMFVLGNRGHVSEAKGDNYIKATFNTIPEWTDTPGSQRNFSVWDNDGDPRFYLPAGRLTTVLDIDGGQSILLTGDPIYLESQKSRPPSGQSVAGSTADSTRYWVFRGPVLREDEKNPQEEFHVAKCSWKDESGMLKTSNASPALYIERWEDPRMWGFDNSPLTSDWVTDAGEIKCAPLGSFDYVPASNQVAYGGPLDESWVVALRILLSTGTMGTWSGNEENVATAEASPPSDGVNDNGVTGAYPLLRANDLEIADMGLGIPNELVTAPATWKEVFRAADELARMKLGYIGPVQADDVLTNILQPAGACWTLSRSSAIPQFSVFRPFQSPDSQDVTISITEADLWGDVDNPTTVIPDQDLRWAQPIDRFSTPHHWNPVEKSYGRTWETGSRDSGARYRGGKVIHEFQGAGLVHEVLAQEGVNKAGWPNSYSKKWADEAAKWWAARHFVVKGLPVKRYKAWEIEPGTRVKLTNDWLLLPDGTIGCTNAVGTVIRAREFTASGHKELDILVDANLLNLADMRIFAPIARVQEYNSGTYKLTCDLDYWGRGENSDLDLFVRPDWSPHAAGNAKIRIVYYDRNTWTTGPTGTVSSVASDEITLTGALTGTWYKDKISFVIMDDYDTGSQAAWVLGMFGYHTDPDYELGTGPTAGWPFPI